MEKREVLMKDGVFNLSFSVPIQNVTGEELFFDSERIQNALREEVPQILAVWVSEQFGLKPGAFKVPKIQTFTVSHDPFG